METQPARWRERATRAWRACADQPPLWPLTLADGVFLGVLLALGLAILAPSLSHPYIPFWDEGMHQAAARGTYETPLYPHIYAEHLYPWDVRLYWISQAWMNKPPAPFWFAAAVMKVVGITPFALRFGSLLGALAAASAIFLLGRTLAGRLIAAVTAAIFLCLPFGWQLVQGLFFGDATDCTLVGCNALAFLLLAYSVERQSWRAALGAGAVVGLGVLCKVMLALTPLGVAGVLWFFGRVRLCRGPKLLWVVGMALVAAAVCVPWNVYAAHTWPESYWMHARTWLGHLGKVSGPQMDIGPWTRPVDGIFNEINNTELRPVATALSLVAGLWLLIRAFVRRDAPSLMVALWLWSTWIMLSVSSSKVPAVAWGATPAVFIAIAVLFSDGARLAPVGFAAAAAALSPLAVERWPALGQLRAHLPAALVQTRQIPGLAEGLTLALGAAILAVPLWFALRRWPRARPALAVPVLAVLAWVAVRVPPARAALEAEQAPKLWVSHTREVGLAIGKATPARSVLFQDFEREPGEASEVLNQIFWSGRMTYKRAPDVETAKARGYHPYLISPAAEPFAPVDGVPGHAWLRAYDLERPTPSPAPLPSDVLRLEGQAGGMQVLGAAAGPASFAEDRWAFYVRSPQPPGELRVSFMTAAGPVEVAIPPTNCLRDGQRLAGAAWFVLPTLGPKRKDVEALRFNGGPPLPIPAS